jgi:O-antigen ligase
MPSDLATLYGRATSSRFWRFCIDLYPVLIAASLPWSTTAVVVFLSIWLIVVLPSAAAQGFVRLLRNPAAYLPAACFGLAVLGLFWANPLSWTDRLQGLGPLAKLLVLPLLLFHFQRSTRVHWVFLAFLFSCVILLAYSWTIYALPEIRFTAAHGFDITGVPVRNAIDQNQEFALCAFGLAALSIERLRQRRFVIAFAALAVAVAFIGNVMFVALARTSLLYILVLTVLLVVRYLDRRMSVVALALASVIGVLIWFGSPYLRGRVEHISIEYREYQETNRPTSAGQRLAYWKESLGWIHDSPILGHGTGSVRWLFERAAIGKEGAWAHRIGNPHNQTLYAAIQWGFVGCAFLYAMWFVHWRLFRATDLVSWIGLIVVVQNVLSSLLNSHLIDFSEGWIYVLGVGVAGGFKVGQGMKGRDAELQRA